MMATGSDEPMVDHHPKTPQMGSSDPKDGCFGRKKRHHHHDHKKPHSQKHGAAADADVEIQNTRRRKRPKKKDPLAGLAQSMKKNAKFTYLVALKKGTPIATITSNDKITKMIASTISSAKGSGVLVKTPRKMAAKAAVDVNGSPIPSTSSTAQPKGGTVHPRGMRKATSKTKRRTAKLINPISVGLPIHINLSMVHPNPMAAPIAVAM